MGRHTQSVMGVPLFTWDGWDIVEEGCLQFYNVKFLVDDLKQYNTPEDKIETNEQTTSSLSIDGELEVYIAENQEPVFKGFVVELPSFLQKVSEKYGN